MVLLFSMSATMVIMKMRDWIEMDKGCGVGRGEGLGDGLISLQVVHTL